MKLFTVNIQYKNMKAVTGLSDKVTKQTARDMNGLSRRLTDFAKRYLSGPTNNFNVSPVTGTLRKKTRPLATNINADSVVGGMVFGETPYTGIHVGRRGRSPITIRPKRSMSLAIPLPAAKTAGGRLQQRFQVGSLRDVPKLKRNKKGNMLIMGRTPMFVLRKSVTIPARVHPDYIAELATPFLTVSLKKSLSAYLGR